MTQIKVRFAYFCHCRHHRFYHSLVFSDFYFRSRLGPEVRFARPWALTRGKPGARLELKVTFHHRRNGLPDRELGQCHVNDRGVLSLSVG